MRLLLFKLMETQFILKLLDNVKNDGASAIVHKGSEETPGKMGFVKMRKFAAFGKTVFVNRTPVFK